jgi:2-succinyl-5-enolpyruvyl-6-hydroxy-3-cyclohexene-1-carboxylate synthase
VNLSNAAKVIEFVRSVGVVDFCLCAGARNSPFITLLDENKVTLESGGHLFHFFDERSAAFFALGRAQQFERPVVIITTSGTAVTELTSAIVEAFYTKTPLIVITADRPPKYRGSGAPQAIEQIGIFSHYALPTVDLYEDFSILENFDWNKSTPLHLNVCFAEPLLRGPIPELKLNFRLKTVTHTLANSIERQHLTLRFIDETIKHPLFIVSGLIASEREYVAKHLNTIKGAWWVESLSGLRGHSALEEGRIRSGDRFLQHLMHSKFFDGVIRIGAVPTSRVWRDLEEELAVPVLSFTNGNWSGLARASRVEPLNKLETLARELTGRDLSLTSDLKQKDSFLTERILSLLSKHPKSQPSLVRQLSQLVNDRPLYLGNSLPVREWDWAAVPTLPMAISGNRGANGIDGQLSTFFGWLPEEGHSWALLGDLTTLYDLSAPWILSQLKKTNWTLAIMNNSGGHIFKPMFNREAFINKHSIDFLDWARMWGMTYSCLDSLEMAPESAPQILELKPSEVETQNLRGEMENLWAHEIS